MTQDPTRADFEEWLNKTIDCKYEYDPVTGYVPQEVYQLYQAWQAATKHQSDKCAGLVGALESIVKCYSFSTGEIVKGAPKFVFDAIKALKEHRDSVEGGA